MIRKMVAASVTCAVLVCAIWLPSASGQQTDPLRLETMEWVCTIQYACINAEGNVTHLPVTGEPSADKDVAWASAVAYCEGAISGHPDCECCNTASPTICDITSNMESDCLEIQTLLKSITAKKTDKYEERTFTIPVSTPIMRFEIEGISIDDHKRYSLATIAGAARAVEQFRSIISRHGGAVAGSVRTRTVPHFLYRCYLRVRSRDGMVERNDEVEGQGETQEIAFQNALVAVDLLIDANAFTNVERLPGPRFTRVDNWCVGGDIFKRVQCDAACRQTVLCQYECKTERGTRIAVTRHGNTRENACVIAEAAALEFADRFGGVTGECVNAGVFPETLARAACTSCGSGASKAADAENSDAAKTEAANAHSVLEHKTL